MFIPQKCVCVIGAVKDNHEHIDFPSMFSSLSTPSVVSDDKHNEGMVVVID